MSVSVSTTALSMVSAAVAVTSLFWAVRSWRLSGPALRLHCLVYGSEVVIRTFNAGRVPETVEGLVLGGLRTGKNGLDLTEPLGLPFRLEPGESKKWRLDPGADEMAYLASHVHSGWASLWVLTGSMRQHRVEVMPTGVEKPPSVGWTLIPRRVHLTRYLPLVGACVVAIAGTSGTQGWAQWLVAAWAFVVVVRGVHAIQSAYTFPRLRVERWALFGMWVVAVIELTRSMARARTVDVPPVDMALITACLMAGWALAIPGGAAAIIDAVFSIDGWLSHLRHRIKDRLKQVGGRITTRLLDD